MKRRGSTDCPWDVKDLIPAACDQLVATAWEPDARTGLHTADVLVWQRVRDEYARVMEFAVVWLHFMSAHSGGRWALVELCRLHGNKRWWGEDESSEDVRRYIEAIVTKPEADGASAFWLNHGTESERCVCLELAPDNGAVLDFLNRCSFFTPWYDGKQESGDVVEERVINYTSWCNLIGSEPSAEILQRLGKYRAI